MGPPGGASIGGNSGGSSSNSKKPKKKKNKQKRTKPPVMWKKMIITIVALYTVAAPLSLFVLHDLQTAVPSTDCPPVRPNTTTALDAAATFTNASSPGVPTASATANAS